MLASESHAAAHDLPVELVRRILEHAVQQFLEVSMEPCIAARLQLLSRSVRLWLMPMIYYVFVVRWPNIRSSSHTPTQAFFLKLLTERDKFPAVRAAIKHLVFLGESGPEVDTFGIRDRLEEWPVESVCLAQEHQTMFLHGTNIVPRSVFLTMPRYGFNALVNHQHTRPRLEPGTDTFGRCALRELEVVEFACSVQSITQVDADNDTTPDLDLLRDCTMGRSIKSNIHMIRILAARRLMPDGALPINPPLIARLHLSLNSKANISGTVKLLNALMVVQGLTIQLAMVTDSDEEMSVVRELQDALKMEGDPVRSRVIINPVKRHEIVGNGEDLARLLRCGKRRQRDSQSCDPHQNMILDSLKTE